MSSISPNWSSQSPKSLMGFWSQREVSWRSHQLLGSGRQFHYLCDSILAGAAELLLSRLRSPALSTQPLRVIREISFLCLFSGQLSSRFPGGAWRRKPVDGGGNKVLTMTISGMMGHRGRYCGNIKFLLEFMQWISSLDLNWNRGISSIIIIKPFIIALFHFY